MSRDLAASREELARALAQVTEVRAALERQVGQVERSWRRNLLRTVRNPVAPRLRFVLGLWFGFLLGASVGAAVRMAFLEVLRR